MSTALDGLEEGVALMLESIKRLKGADDWIDQHHSPLGRRGHLEAVRSGELPGHRVKKLVLVRRSDLDAYIKKHGSSAKVIERREDGERAEIEAVLNFKPRRTRKSA